MKPEETIELLKGMQNKKVDYAELVCAPAFASGYRYVYPEPEDYAIEEAVKAIKEVMQYREIGTVEECREAVEKQKPKNPEYINGGISVCRECSHKLKRCYDYCPECGQAIKWDDDLDGLEDEQY